jgi:hypothetical protein
MKFLLLAPLLLAACSPMNEEVGRSERAAQDRIMLVRNAPETLGHRRLVYQSAAHPTLRGFLRDEGLPDFIAETSSDDRQYMILYYLDSMSAYSCRTRRGATQPVDVAGPYKMTKRETAVLRELQTGNEERQVGPPREN